MKAAALSAQLAQVYARFPSLAVNATPTALQAAAAKVLDPASAAAVVRAASEQKDVYLAARATALQGGRPTALQQPRRAVVSGLSAGGLMATAVLAKSGYAVEAFEQRTGYSRNIQFSSRQALVDELSSIDSSLPARFFEIAADMEGGTAVGISKGVRTVRAWPAFQAGDPTRVPADAQAMLAPMPSGLVQAKALEQVLLEYVRGLPNVTLHQGKVIELGPKNESGQFSVTGKNAPKRGQAIAEERFTLGTPNLVVAFEGAGSATRAQAGISTAKTSPELKFIAGTVETGPRTASMATSLRRQEPRPDGGLEQVITAALGHAKLDETWVVTGVPESVALVPTDAQGVALDPRAPEYPAALQALVEKEFRKGAALVLDTPVEQAQSLVVGGPIEGGRPSLFGLQLQLSERASAGTNFITGGDTVGTGSFTQGAGMMTATVAHIERLKTLLLNLELGVDQAAALQTYSDGAMSDTLHWGERSMGDFYPNVDRSKAGQAFLEAVARWRADKGKDPLQTLATLVARLDGPQAAVVGAPAMTGS